MIVSSALPWFLCLSLSQGAVKGTENPVPDFDVGKVKASYVVSLPHGYDPKKKWPLILDFHGAIAPSRKGANLTQDRLWSRFVQKAPYIVVGLNSRSRAWGSIKGPKNDTAYALHVFKEVTKKYSIDAQRVYLSGFSSGADFLCSGGLQLQGPFAGSLIVCPGPPNVVGLRNGSLLKIKDKATCLVTGEEDYIRKSGAWQAFLALDKVNAPVVYREVPQTGHAFPPIKEYALLLAQLGHLNGLRKRDPIAIAKQAIAGKDFLLASTNLLRAAPSAESKRLLAEVQKQGEALLREALAVDAEKEPGRAYEAWWRLRTQFHRFPRLAVQAQSRLDAFQKKMSLRDLFRARGDFFRERRKSTTPKQPLPENGKVGKWSFDRYLSYKGLTKHVQDLAKRFGRNRLSSFEWCVNLLPFCSLNLSEGGLPG